MGLIKSPHVPATLSPFSMRDIEAQAKSMLLRARRQAGQLLMAAQAEADALKLAARAEGQQAGHAEGMARGIEEGTSAGQQQALAESRAQLQEAVKALVNASKSLDASRCDLEAGALREVVELSVAIARRVTKRQAQLDPEVLIANLDEALKLVVKSSDVRIAIHPAQRTTLDRAMPQLQLQWPELSHVRIVEDASVSPGGCRILSAGGQIDADLGEQLDRVVADLLPAPGGFEQ